MLTKLFKVVWSQPPPLGLVRRHRPNSCCKKLVITSPIKLPPF
nr:MAG TPA: hypothetical protein [Caudoviricetes sp.]DAW15685.1 MAG TPA: hypothetical protein [Caudoviricetes sp.]